MTEEEFKHIVWPEEFYIQYIGGGKQLFSSSNGVCWDSGANETGENEGRSSISCCWKKKSPSQRAFRLIQVWIDEIEKIQKVDGTHVWTVETQSRR